jgi:predicted nuclease of predicted toxin-antitoxin system
VLLWLDVHLSPAIGSWIEREFGIRCLMMRDLGMQRTEDSKAFEAARAAGATVVTKDADWVALLERLGPPPAVIRLGCGNTSNMHLRGILRNSLPDAIKLLQAGEPLVEIGQP